MTPFEIGLISVVAIVVLVYMGLYIPIALGVVSFVSIWLMRDNFTLAVNLLKIAVGDSVMAPSSWIGPCCPIQPVHLMAKIRCERLPKQGI